MSMTPIPLIVIIATKDRNQALSQYSLPSLENSLFKNFLCIVWDASKNDLSEKAIKRRQWSYPIFYFKAPRKGSSSQRNDAIEYALSTWPDWKYVLFIDDDSEVSPKVLGGVVLSFAEENVWGVGLPYKLRPREKFRHWLIRRFFAKQGKRVAEPYLSHYMLLPELNDSEIDWTQGCGMAFRIEVFRDLALRFPEEFQLFGGYAYGEDLAFSFYLKKKFQKKLMNSKEGYFYHHEYPSGRLNLDRMAAAVYYNLSLLFEAVYEDVKGLKRRLYRAKFLFYLWGMMFEMFCRTQNVDIWVGVGAARKALRKVKSELFIPVFSETQNTDKNHSV